MKFKVAKCLILPIIASVVSATTLRAQTPPTYLFQWGSPGSGNGQFNQPFGIALDGGNNVYVVDANNDRIEKFDHNGDYLSQWGSYGSGNGQFVQPARIAADGSNNVYVTDYANNRVEKFDGRGNYLLQWGSSGGGNGQFVGPEGIATDESNDVYVADGSNNRVEKFDSNGNYLLQWGSSGSGNGQFNVPFGIAVDGSNNVYVTDFYNNRIEKFDSDGNYLTQWGSSGSGNGQFEYPFGIAADSSNNVYVTDYGNDRVEKFDGSGDYLTQWGTSGSGDGEFSTPGSIAVDGSGNFIYVEDAGNSRIEVFANNTNVIPPYIVGQVQPASQSVLVGGSVSFSVGVVGAAPIAYQWISGNVPLPNATNSTLTLTNVTPADATTYAVRVANSFGNALSSNALLTVLPAVVATLPASGITNIGAQLNGSAILGSEETVIWFDWGTDTNYGNISGTDVLPGNSATNSISAALSGLPGNYYHYRLDAANDAGVVYGNDQAFTVGFAPTVATLLPVNQATGLVLNATVNPEGWDTTVYFKWGPGSNRTNTVVIDAGAGVVPTNASTVITGLAQAASFSVQAIASNSLGQAYGTILSFLTPPFVNVPTNNWQSVACSADGTVIIAVVNLLNGSTYGPIFISTNSGTSWLQATNAPHFGWQTVACSADGSKILAGVGGGFGSLLGPVYTSPDGGVTWVSNNLPHLSWESVASSADGTKLAAASQGGIYTSTNGGVAWTKATNAPNLLWEALASSADGSKLVAGAYPGPTSNTNIYTSTNFGATWTTNPVAAAAGPGWISIASSADGNNLLAARGGDGDLGKLFISTNSGESWTATATNVMPIGERPWIWVASSADGSKLVALANSTYVGSLYNSFWVSTNSGATWVSNNVANETWTSAALSADGASLVATVGWPTTSSYIYVTHKTPSPVLSLSPPDANGNLGLLWLIPSLDFTLQQSPDLINWSDVTNAAALNLTNLQNQVALPLSDGNGFYRLIH